MTKVTINGFDLDEVIVSGSALTHSVQTASRFNSETYNNPHSLNDEWKYTRYFPKSGTYRMKVIYNDGSAGGIIDFGIDSPAGNNLIDGLDTQSSSGRNKERFTTAEISRGNHDISMLCQADGGASDYQFAWHMIQFDLINEHPVLGEATASPRNGMELLASVELSSTASEIDSGTFTAKKFLWVQGFANAVSATDIVLEFNSDTDNNYARINEANGGTDTTAISQPHADMGYGIGSNSHNKFFNSFIINNASNEKLMINHVMHSGGAGAGNSPSRNESVNKWSDTSDQITQIKFQAIDSSGFGSGSFLKVWGMD
jgi:hypothetical protein